MARNILRNTKNRSSKAAARTIHANAVEDEARGGEGTAYRRAMDAVVDEVNRLSKTAKPELRKKLDEVKDELRRLTGNEQSNPKGKGAPTGRYVKKHKAKSRRNVTQPPGAPNKPRR